MKRSSKGSQGDRRKFFCTRTSKDECQEKVAVVGNEVPETTQDNHQTEATQTCTMDLETLKDVVTKDPVLSFRCIILTWMDNLKSGNGCPYCNRSSHATTAIAVINKFCTDSIQNAEIMGNNLMLVTAKDSDKQYDMFFHLLGEDTGLSVCAFTLKVATVRPLPARIHVIVVGIPLLLTTNNESDFMSSVGEVLPLLSDLQVEECVQIEYTTMFSISGYTADFVTAKDQLKQGNYTVTFMNFTGKLTYHNIVKHVKLEDTGTLTDHDIVKHVQLEDN